MEYTQKYKEIVNELIEKSFPVLKGKKIIISERENKRGRRYMAKVYDFVFYIGIAVYKRSRKFSVRALKGLFAHELSHMEIIHSMNVFRKIGFLIQWYLLKKVRAKFEREADLLLIRKGYGKEFITLLKKATKKYSKKRLEERVKKGYLSLKEIKAYMKKLKK